MRNEEDKAYLANKHKGGEANAKGGLYEDFYAVFQIVSCIAHYKATLDSVALQTQLEDTFVDDLLIAHPDKNVYHQLKLCLCRDQHLLVICQLQLVLD